MNERVVEAYVQPWARGSKEIMFWTELDPPSKYAGLVQGVSRDDFVLAVSLLRSGKRLLAYKGSAGCRICGATLGSCDFGLFDFVWPENAEHYVEAHGVWTQGLAELNAAARAFRG